MAVEFSSFQTTFKLPNPKRTSAWIARVVKTEQSRIASLAYIFCSDRYLLKINQDYLDHDTLTDIITFDYSIAANAIDGEIYISVPRVRENARQLGNEFEIELHRVIIHGVLHLLGYGDKTLKEKKMMRAMEEKYLKSL